LYRQEVPVNETDEFSAKAAGESRAASPNGGRPARHGCLTALMVLVGVLFLLPGLCTLFFSGNGVGVFSDPVFGMVAMATLAVGIGGIVLIWLALRGQRR
jgi:hypothetical protein